MTARLVLCSLVADAACVVPGSVERRCRDCDRPVWVSPSTIRAERQTDVAWQYVCGRCLIKDGPPVVDVQIVPGSMEELLEVARGGGRRGDS